MLPEGFRGEPVLELGHLLQQMVAYCKNTTVNLGSWSFTFWDYIWWQTLALIVVIVTNWLINEVINK